MLKVRLSIPVLDQELVGSAINRIISSHPVYLFLH